jgi:hypothetical protein
MNKAGVHNSLEKVWSQKLQISLKRCRRNIPRRFLVKFRYFVLLYHSPATTMAAWT